MCRDLLELDAFKSGCPLYFWERNVRVPLSEEERAAQDAKPTELALGTAEGFSTEKRQYSILKEHAVAVVARGELVLVRISDALPELVRTCVEAIMAKESASRQDDVQVWREDVQVRAATCFQVPLLLVPCSSSLALAPPPLPLAPPSSSSFPSPCSFPELNGPPPSPSVPF